MQASHSQCYPHRTVGVQVLCIVLSTHCGEELSCVCCVSGALSCSHMYSRSTPHAALSTELQVLSTPTLSGSALARLDFSGLSGDACSSLRYLAQVNALRAATAAGNKDAAVRCAALGCLAAGLPAPAETGELYQRLMAATQHTGGICALPLLPVIPVVFS